MEGDELVTTVSDILDNASDEYLEYHEHHEYHDYSEDDAATKMHHLMHSDTIIVVFSLVVMIMVGLVFRSLCMKLTSINQRKERVRGGLKQIAESMNYVTRYYNNINHCGFLRSESIKRAWCLSQSVSLSPFGLNICLNIYREGGMKTF